MDIYQTVTDQIIAALEQAQQWEKPWTDCFASADGSLIRPLNAVTMKPYRGINVPMLWSAGRSSPFWATYKAWQERGAQVRKGERGSLVVFWKQVERQAENDDEAGRYLVARGYTVFNAEQV